MKAIVLTEYGSSEVLQLKELNRPIPKSRGDSYPVKSVRFGGGKVRIYRRGARGDGLRDEADSAVSNA